jgi:hypothetical protein
VRSAPNAERSKQTQSSTSQQERARTIVEMPLSILKPATTTPVRVTPAPATPAPGLTSGMTAPGMTAPGMTAPAMPAGAGRTQARASFAATHTRAPRRHDSPPGAVAKRTGASTASTASVHLARAIASGSGPRAKRPGTPLPGTPGRNCSCLPSSRDRLRDHVLGALRQRTTLSCCRFPRRRIRPPSSPPSAGLRSRCS